MGLPQENYIFAMGQLVSAEQAAEGAKRMAKYLQAKEITDALGKEKAEKLGADFKEWYGMTRGGAFSVSSLPPGPGGLLGLSMVFKVTDSAKWMERSQAMVTLVKGIETEDEQVATLLKAVTYQSGAGTVGGVSVAELSLDASGLEDVEPEDLDQMKKVLGQDGLLVRLGAVDDRHVVVAFGGGEARMGELIAQAKAGKAPLSNDPGIKRVAPKLPKAKTSEGYIALDRIMGLVTNIFEAMGEQAPPINIAEVNAPIAFANAGDKTLTHVEVFLPMELVVSVKDGVMQAMGMMMGGGMQPGMGGPPTGATDDDMMDDEEEEAEEEKEPQQEEN